MADTQGIGCGIYPFILKDTKFYPACEWHDNAYTTGSWQERNMSREQVDNWFLDQMLFLAGNNAIDRARAYLFYGIARTFGGAWWEGL